MVSQCDKHSSNSMKRGETLGLIPTDLIMEIFSRLPAKSVARFRSLSKVWGSMLRLPYFTELFLTKSSARPRLLFAIRRCNEWLFFSSPQPQNPYNKSSLVLVPNFHMKFLGLGGITSYASSGGLIFCPKSCILGETVRVICNPTTGKYAILPKLILTSSIDVSIDIFGFDPIDKQYKVLVMDGLLSDETVHHILTLGTENMRWRRIQCPLRHRVCGSTGSICINGVLYYLANKMDNKINLLVCFDVRSEKFKFVDAELPYDYLPTTLINYKGKLGVIKNYDYDYATELRMWVLEDMEKHEWSKYVYTLPEKKILDYYDISVDGVTATGEIVFSSWEYACKPFYIFYHNPEKNTLQKIVLEIQGFEGNHEGGFYTLVDYVEDLRFNDVNQLNLSIYAPYVKNKLAQPKYHYGKAKTTKWGRSKRKRQG